MASIGNVSATISANATGFIAEFERADNVAKRKAAAIGKEIDKLTTDIKRKFSISGVGKDLLAGFGIGSALGIFNTAAGLIAANFREAAEAAKAMKEATEYTLKAERERSLIGATEQEKLKAQVEDLRELEKTRARLLAGTTVRAPSLGINGTTFIEQLVPASHEARMAALALTKQIEDLKTTIAEKTFKRNTGGVENALDQFFGPMEEQLRLMGDMPTSIREADMALREKLATESKTTEEMRKQRAIKAEEAALNDDFEIPNIDIAPPQIAKWTQYQEGMLEIFTSIGERSAATFSEMVRTGENALDSLLDSVADAFLQMAFRMGVVNPLLNSVFGLSGASILPAFFGVGAGKADGGQVNSGMMYPVGERGIEMFAPSTSGTIIPNHKLGGGSARNVYNIDARGASTDAVKELRAMMSAMNASIEPRSVAAVRDADKRRK